MTNSELTIIIASKIGITQTGELTGNGLIKEIEKISTTTVKLKEDSIKRDNEIKNIKDNIEELNSTIIELIKEVKNTNILVGEFSNRFVEKNTFKNIVNFTIKAFTFLSATGGIAYVIYKFMDIFVK